MTRPRIPPDAPKFGKCVALDMNGKRCRRDAVEMIRYHGDPELYGSYLGRNEPGWLLAALCDKHAAKP